MVLKKLKDLVSSQVKPADDFSPANIISAYKVLFSSELGKQVLLDLMQRAGVDYAGFEESTNRMYYDNGRRSLGIEVLNLLDMDVEALRQQLRMMEDEL